MNYKSIALVASTLALSIGADAAIITFTDRDAWRIAAGGGIGNLSEDFTSFSGTTNYGTLTGTTAGFLNFSTVSGSYGYDPSWSIRDTSIAGSKAVDGSSYISLVSYGRGAGDTLITHSDIAAFGFDYSGPTSSSNSANPLTLTTSLGDNITGPSITKTSSGFFGFIYTENEVFSSIQIRDLTDGQTFFGADNFEAFSTASVVPIPAAVWLFGSGLIGLIGVARRKKA